MAPEPIDVWNVETFDPGLIALLKHEADLIREFTETDHQIFLQHNLGRGPNRSILRPENPHASDFFRLQEAVALEMQSRTIRAFHYTRLTDAEIATLQREGVHLSTPATLRARLSALVAARVLTTDVADALYERVPSIAASWRRGRTNSG